MSVSSIQGKWIWYELMTSDAAGAKAFYEAVVGWQIELGSEPPIFYGHLHNADGGDTGGVLPLTAEMAAHGARPAWIGYIAVDDVDAAVAAIEAKGGKALMPKTTIDVGSFAMVADPDGAPFYVMTPQMSEAHPESSTAFSPDRPGRCSWNELKAGDQAGAIIFYTAMFGWGLPEPMNMGAMGKYQFITDGSTDCGAIGAIMAKPPFIPAPPHWSFYFRVPSITEAVKVIGEKGGQVVNGPMEVPGGDWVINGIDPQGAAFGLVGAKG
jgi:predicted enzyme related to lactoylglutathione lyase